MKNLYEAAVELFGETCYLSPEENKIYNEAINKLYKPTGIKLFIKPEVFYDKTADILSIRIKDVEEQYGDEIGNNIVLKRDTDTDEIVGLDLYNVKRYVI